MHISKVEGWPCFIGDCEKLGHIGYDVHIHLYKTLKSEVGPRMRSKKRYRSEAGTYMSQTSALVQKAENSKCSKFKFGFPG